MSVPSSGVEKCLKNAGSKWMHRGQCEVWLVLRKSEGTRQVAGACTLHHDMAGANRALEGNEEAGRNGSQQDKGRKNEEVKEERKLPGHGWDEETKEKSHTLCGPGSAVRVVTAYALDGPGIESRWGEIFRTSPAASCKLDT